jgi:hypothetical protein
VTAGPDSPVTPIGHRAIGEIRNSIPESTLAPREPPSMTAFRAALVLLWLAVAGYTAVVVSHHGIDLVSVFLSDFRAMGWPGQFDLDFLGMLLLSGLWVAWRHDFSARGLGLGLLATVGGILFLAAYLLVLSLQANGRMKDVLLGARRAAA